MKPISLREDIFWIGVNDEKTDLFEGLWPIRQEGISYNSYLVRDEKTALIDLCKDIYQDEYLSSLKSLIDPASIDCLVVNHMEPDHSGALRAFRAMAPRATILATRKAVQMLADFFGIRENIRVVEDGEELALGKHTLRFITAPMVHWPETMMTYEKTSGTLFSCDAFGGYGRLTNGIFDDDYNDHVFFEREALRYYANIVAAFSKPVLNAGEKLAGLPVHTVAPSHGLVWRRDPARIINLYLNWSEYGKGRAEAGVTLLRGSMYGNTDRLADAVADGLRAAGVHFSSHDVRETHVSYILPDLWVNQGVMIGAPTYEGALFPTMALVLHMAEIKRVFHRDAAYFGSYGWGGGATRSLGRQLEALKWPLHETLEVPGGPGEEDLAAARALGLRFGERALAAG
jgi:flavorubredoxin